jgi:putative addiction module component (TIGR02574 family)
MQSNKKGKSKMAGLTELLQQALNLDVRDRATLAERLLASLDDLTEPEAERLWAEEAQRRLEAYRVGRATAVPSEAVHEKLQRLFR